MPIAEVAISNLLYLYAALALQPIVACSTS